MKMTMRMGIAMLVLGASLAASGAHATRAVDCGQLDAATSGPDDNFRPPASGTVIGTGRAYFYSAPDAQCMTKQTFIVPGDSVTVYKSHGRWYNIMYVNGKTGDDFEGWVEQGRVRLDGRYGAQ
ncbi:SH3 domain-containing protein [Burkholderia cenocepacia]|uniref:SH3 domain-containing protein n=1 Tax=Burkholderia cenocepacia TaxID=95486 RepID=UPI0018820660|nr:SH3 domain-containing protein [Burkholderia cenocepacia]MEB2501151.1 SH3 domain-containing protein [Burkholderia cenocepacia]MEB2558945.1 SH3 domain-containing protein [Burkholderia cenocepacia]